MFSRNFFALSIGLLITSLMEAVLALPSPANGNIQLAQAPQADKVPTAGAILGWELNMNRNYSQKLEREIQNQPKKLDEPRVIFFENAKKEPLSEHQFLLNTARPVKP